MHPTAVGSGRWDVRQPTRPESAAGRRSRSLAATSAAARLDASAPAGLDSPCSTGLDATTAARLGSASVTSAGLESASPAGLSASIRPAIRPAIWPAAGWLRLSAPLRRVLDQVCGRLPRRADLGRDPVRVHHHDCRNLRNSVRLLWVSSLPVVEARRNLRAERRRRQSRAGHRWWSNRWRHGYGPGDHLLPVSY